MADANQSGRPSRRKRKAAPVTDVDVFRAALKVKRLRKTTVLITPQETPSADSAQPLVADHEWDSLLHNFEHQPDAHASGDVVDELWDRLDSTRWLKDATPEEGLDPV